jgi:hypothetical protein
MPATCCSVSWLPVFFLKTLYRHEIWSLKLREEHKLRVFESRVQRRIFGPKREDMAGGWRRLHNEELHNLYISPYIIRIIKSRSMIPVEHVACMGGMTNGWKT